MWLTFIGAATVSICLALLLLQILAASGQPLVVATFLAAACAAAGAWVFQWLDLFGFFLHYQALLVPALLINVYRQRPPPSPVAENSPATEQHGRRQVLALVFLIAFQLAFRIAPG
jgi:hypothetical protein